MSRATQSNPNTFASPHASGSEHALGPLTYRVYASDSAPNLRSGSVAAFGEDSSVSTRPRRQLSVGAYVCLMLVGVCIVIATAGVVLLGTGDEPVATAAKSGANVPALAPPPALDAPPPVVAAVTPAPEAAPSAKAATAAKPAKIAKPKARTSVRAPARRGLGGFSVPPNPFGAPLHASRSK